MSNTFRRWGPDTCGCNLFYQYDDALSEDAVVHSYIAHADAQTLSNQIRDANGNPRVIQDPEVACSAHIGLAGTLALWGACQDENTRKNISQGIAQGLITGLKEETDGKEFQWSFNPARVLLITLVNVDAGEATSVGAALDIQFGPGKVMVI